MSSKKIAKIGSMLMIIATILMVVNMVYAIPTGDTGVATSNLGTTTNNIIGIVQYICYAAAVILLVVLGVRFMMASPEGKAEIKKSAVIYVVGAVLVFSAGLILNLVKKTGDATIK